jgi:1-deoxy-D-xylulose-5-phosphate reductoisomerase
VVHSLVEFQDGSVLAQMGNPDMRVPIAFGLAWPERIESGTEPLDLLASGSLGFEAPDLKRFPCLGLAMEASAAGRSHPIVLNAANEVAVEAFLAERLGFTSISRVIAATLEALPAVEPESLEHVKAIDAEARAFARRALGKAMQVEA